MATYDAARAQPGGSPPGASAVPRLRVQGLGVRFGGLDALVDVGLEVADGEVVGLIGPNGAGKTTLFNAVCALVKPRTGTVEVAGAPAPGRPHELPDVGIARTLQGLGVLPDLSVLENVLVSVLRRPDRDERAAVALKRVGLTHRAGDPVGALPYPEQKRVALARALATRPRLLLLDEPAGGLGPVDVLDLGTTIRDVAADGCAVLLVEHHVDFVMGVCDRVVVLDFGRVIATGRPDEVRRDPAVEEAYLGIKVAR
ncbi:ABC transporter ATP-binding protein [Kineosporia rhizophila]|uniref:ABC transporter ATP-binding protein n=1 Tax=Kineosporia TaxID=49184 RepID=UPI001E60765B|nr:MULTISPECIES: ABC transporter ATP-binding protein [Kineosporia]MCE0536406.1 ABC transporter ATP-binding protein [Kineosporia rhizophila]GLY15502.1 ABC transporter ATP-binding protein [Kineosporia sp. NBRC 101677]